MSRSELRHAGHETSGTEPRSSGRAPRRALSISRRAGRSRSQAAWSAKTGGLQAVCDAGGGTRTPDTRIMIGAPELWFASRKPDWARLARFTGSQICRVGDGTKFVAQQAVAKGLRAPGRGQGSVAATGPSVLADWLPCTLGGRSVLTAELSAGRVAWPQALPSVGAPYGLGRRNRLRPEEERLGRQTSRADRPCG